ncbi:hypothetical protein F5Y14DRAFT_121148 [Nemania sp. NC0429]|nr:hypothetical protein F5Y14DRAFT_121148 [Nemania sp. NC0429]
MYVPPACGLCGTGNGHSTLFNSQWSSYYRAVYCIGSNSDEPHLSGLALYREQDDIKYLPPKPHQRLDDAHLDPSSWITIQGLSPPGPDIPEAERVAYAWGFQFHDSCWRLMEQACMPRPVDLKLLWRILRSVPHSSPSHLPLWGHNFGGLYLGTRRRGQGESFLLLAGASNLMIPSAYHDPFDVPELKTRLAQTRISNDGGVVSMSQGPAPIAFSPTPSAASDPFSLLPPELREMILTYIATNDLLAFRLSSRVIAATLLPQCFFRSRFWPGRELDFLFDGFLPGPSISGIDWKELYRSSKERIKYNLVGLGERNRLRIWKQTVRPLAQAIDKVAKVTDLKGKSNWLGNPDDPVEIRWIRIETYRNIDPRLFGDLKRHVFETEIDLPSKIEAIHVSLIEFFGTKFISGLAFETEHGEDIEIGYIIPGSEEPVLVQGSLIGFYAALHDCGFQAIAPFTSQSTPSEYLDWAGNREHLPTSFLRCKGTVRRLRATFDGFRMQALYIPDSNGTHYS